MKRKKELEGLRKKKPADLLSTMQEAHATHFKHVLSLRAGQLKEIHMLGNSRRHIARIKTVINEHVRQAQEEAASNG